MTIADPPEARRMRRWVAPASWAYLALVLAILAMIRLRGDRWWPPTIFLFLPRWPFLAPIAVLMAMARKRRRLWAIHGATALVVLGPLMAFNVPRRGLIAKAPTGARFRILTFNVGDGPIDAEGLIRLIEGEHIELICFQEGRVADPRLASFFAKGWWSDRRGTVLSRFPIVQEWDPADHWEGNYDYLVSRTARVRVRTPGGAEFVVASVHLPTMRPGFHRLAAADLDGFRREIAWRDGQTRALAGQLAEVSRWPTLVGGDLNTPADSPMLDPLRARFSFAFERTGWGYGYTRPTALPWTRIDHLFAGPGWEFTRCRVGPDLGSDHLPLIAEVALTRRGH